MRCNASIVLYDTPFFEVENVVHLLRQNSYVHTIFLIDNSTKENTKYQSLPVTYIFNNKNIGYGSAHNIALRKTILENIPYHLIINADIDFRSDILSSIVRFMHENTQIGQLMPKIFYPNGKIQYLCKLIPTPLDLFGRRFLPNGWMKKRTEQFELQKTNYNQIMNVPYLSGCFMFLRTEALKKVGLFDERFFMYPEDIDLTRRIHKYYKTIFYPEVSVIHNHAQESYKTRRLLWIHATNLIKYFNKWGWFWDKERTQINKTTVANLKHNI